MLWIVGESMLHWLMHGKHVMNIARILIIRQVKQITATNGPYSVVCTTTEEDSVRTSFPWQCCALRCCCCRRRTSLVVHDISSFSMLYDQAQAQG